MRPGGGGAVCRVPPERLEHQFNKFAADLRLVAGGFAIGLDDAREMVDEVEDRPGRFAHVTLFLLARGIASPALRAGAKVEYTCRASSVKALLCLGLAIAILALVRYKTSPVQRNLVLPHALRTAGWMQQFASTAGSPSAVKASASALWAAGASTTALPGNATCAVSAERSTGPAADRRSRSSARRTASMRTGANTRRNTARAAACAWSAKGAAASLRSAGTSIFARDTITALGPARTAPTRAR